MSSISQDIPQSEPAQPESPPLKVARLRLDRGAGAHMAVPESDQLSRWGALKPLVLDPETLARHHLYAEAEAEDSDIVTRFDFLRTMVSGAMKEHGILRLGVCAPTAGCGASFVAANLALAMARRPSARVMLADLDLRRPSLARLFGVTAPGALADVLTGRRPVTEHLRLARDNLAVLLNSQPATNSSEILQEPATGQALRDIRDHFAPTAEIYDLPPLLGSDQALSILPEMDGILLVTDGTVTTAADMKAAERLCEGRTTLVGLVLNRGEVREPVHTVIAGFFRRLFRRRNGLD